MCIIEYTSTWSKQMDILKPKQHRNYVNNFVKILKNWRRIYVSINPHHGLVETVHGFGWHSHEIRDIYNPRDIVIVMDTKQVIWLVRGWQLEAARASVSCVNREGLSCSKVIVGAGLKPAGGTVQTPEHEVVKHEIKVRSCQTK